MMHEASDLVSAGCVSGLYNVRLISDVILPPPIEVDWRCHLVYLTIITGRNHLIRPKGHPFFAILPNVSKNRTSYSCNSKRILQMQLLPETQLTPASHRCDLNTACENRGPRHPAAGLCNFALLHTNGVGRGKATTTHFLFLLVETLQPPGRLYLSIIHQLQSTN